MKNNFFAAVLVGLLFLSTLASIALLWRYNSSVRYLQGAQRKMSEINTVQSIMSGLYNETVAYNQTNRNADLARLLQTAITKK